VDFQEAGLAKSELRSLLEKKLLPHMMDYGHPAFQSMFNSFPEEGAEWGGRIALAYNQGVTNWQVSPAGASLEELCGRALCRLFGLDSDAEATFMYCGTYANHQALYMALHRYAEKRGFDLARDGLSGFSDLTRLKVLASRDAHFSLRHTLRFLGLGENSLVPLNVDRKRRIDVLQLKRQLPALRDQADIICLVATAGTTSTGSVDPLLPLAEISRSLNSWFHVDGAYGLAYSLVPERKDLFKGMDLADSLSWDPHKQLGVPIPCSLLFVRDKREFNRMTLYSDYFNRPHDNKPNPGLKSAPSTRPFSALPLAVSLRFQGLNNVIERLRAPLENIRLAAKKIKVLQDVELCLEPDTGILCFRITPESVPATRLNRLQEYIFQRIMEEGRRTLSITRLDQDKVLRLVVVSPQTGSRDLLETVETARSLAAEFEA
jgi:L-2,4-diaminobutyrate decarboxylase